MKVILFDIGNVLVNFEFARLYEIHSRHSGRPVTPFSEADMEVRDAMERGEVSEEEWADYLNRSRGLAWTPADVIRAWRELFTLNEAGYGLFRKAVDSNVRVYTLSNIARHHMDAIEENWNGFFDGATGLFLSYQIGIRKPNPDIYHHALNKLGVPADQCLFIDDLPENIAAARAIGFNALRFIPENHAVIEDALNEFIEG
ncbi:MAG TPA: HAD family phosphatase [Pontiella sp.]